MSIDKQIINKIKGKGYWQIEVTPTTYKQRFSLSECKKIVKEAQVQLRGWYYPDISDNTEEFFIGNNYVENFCDWKDHLEVWRFYTSGQFVHYLALWEDIDYANQGFSGNSHTKQNPSGTILEIRATIWTITELFQFIKNIYSENKIDQKITFSIKLDNVLNRKLQYSDGLRNIGFRNFKCQINTIQINLVFDSEEFLNSYKDLAVKVTFEIFERFNCNLESYRESLKKHQQELLTRQI